MTRLSPSELVVLIDPAKTWGYDTARADLAALVLDGWAEARPSSTWLTFELLLYAPRGPERYPEHVRALHDVLARAAAGQPLRGQVPGSFDKRGQIEKALQAAWGLGSSATYTLKMTAPALIARGLLAETQGSALFGLFKPTVLVRTPAGQAVGAAIDRRLDAQRVIIDLLKSDPARAVAIGCSLGNLLVAAMEQRKYHGFGITLGRLGEAAAVHQGPLPPVPPPFALAPGEEAWAALAPPPLTPAGLAALAAAAASIARLNLALRSH